MSDSGGASRTAKKGGSGVTILLLLLVVAAIGFIGYYGFVETGAVAPAPSPRDPTIPSRVRN